MTVISVETKLYSDAFSKFTRRFVDFDRTTYEDTHKHLINELLKVKEPIRLTVPSLILRMLFDSERAS